MVYTYSDIKDFVKSREPLFYDYYSNFFKLFEELYNPEDIKFLYIKNIFNSNEIETLLFFEGKFVIVTKQESNFMFEENSCKVVLKKLYAHHDSARSIQLTLQFDNGKEIAFDNRIDSNEGWAGDYGSDIKELYKLI